MWLPERMYTFHDRWNNISAKRSVITARKASALKSGASNSDDPKPLRIGVLSAAGIAFLGLVEPVSTHASSFVTAIASRDKSKAEDYIQQKKPFLTGECTAYGSYDELLNDSDVDAVFIPLPNGLHHRLALAALKKGKHVMIEKPIASNAQQAREIRDAAKVSGKVALEAFHWRFHPAAGYLKSLLLSGEYGNMLSIDARYAMFGGLLKREEDIRFKYDLAGGSCMDLTYVFSAITYLGVRDATDPNFEFEVLDAKFRLSPYDSLIDEQVESTILLRDPHPYGRSDNAHNSHDGTGSSSPPPPSPSRQVRATVGADLSAPPLLGIIPRFWSKPMVTIQTEKAEITFDNFMSPWLHHTITITPVTRDPADSQKILRRGKKIKKKCYKGGPLWQQEESRTEGGAEIGEEWWTTWRYQLEGFVRRVQGGEAYAGPWVTLDESVKVMEMIDAVYAKGGLPVRGA